MLPRVRVKALRQQHEKKKAQPQPSGDNETAKKMGAEKKGVAKKQQSSVAPPLHIPSVGIVDVCSMST